MVFGDGHNDLEMIQSAKYSYAMKNAVDELKSEANFIAPSNQENGVLEVIKNKVLTDDESFEEEALAI